MQMAVDGQCRASVFDYEPAFGERGPDAKSLSLRQPVAGQGLPTQDGPEKRETEKRKHRHDIEGADGIVATLRPMSDQRAYNCTCKDRAIEVWRPPGRHGPRRDKSDTQENSGCRHDLYQIERAMPRRCCGKPKQQCAGKRDLHEEEVQGHCGLPG